MNLRWYAARLRAMSPAEVGWRARHEASRRLRKPPLPSPPDWRHEPWLEQLDTVLRPQTAELVAAAERIARGERELWGRPVVRGSADVKHELELNRMQHLVPLAAGARFAQRGDWARLALEELLEAPMPASGYEAAHRLVGWAWAVPLVAEHATEDELARIADAYAAQVALTHATPSRYSSANNHRIVELTGLLAAATLGSVDWDDSWAELEHEVERQTFRDGGSREQAGGYFLYVLETLWVAGLCARAAGKELGRVGTRLRAMLDWLAATADAHGEPPPLGDDAEDRILRLDYFDTRRAAVIAARVASLLDSPVPPVDGASRVLPESGLAVLRAGDTRVVFDVGPLGFGSLAAHGHADALSVLLDIAGRTVLRDSGTGAYAPPSVREPFRATLAHNTVVVDGASQAEPKGSHLWGRRYRVEIEAVALGSDVDYVRASHDGYRRSPARALHTRSVFLVKPDALVVLDRVRAERPCTATLVWQGKADVASAPEARREDDQGPWSPRFTWIEQAPRSRWTADGRDIVFASTVGLDKPARVTSLDHTDEVTRLTIDDRVTIEENWSATEPRIG